MLASNDNVYGSLTSVKALPSEVLRSILRFLLLLSFSAIPAAPQKTWIFEILFAASETSLRFRTLLVAETLPAAGLFSFPWVFLCHMQQSALLCRKSWDSYTRIQPFWATCACLSLVLLVVWLPHPSFSYQGTVFSLAFSCRCTLSPRWVDIQFRVLAHSEMSPRQDFYSVSSSPLLSNLCDYTALITLLLVCDAQLSNIGYG